MWSVQQVACELYHRQSKPLKRNVIAGWICGCFGMIGVTTEALAQTSATGQEAGTGSAHSQLLPTSRSEVADDEHLSWTLKKLKPQPYMREFYLQYPDDTPAFFRDSLVQYVARTYVLSRDNSDGTRSQAGAAGGWLAYRSGLLADMFGVHAAFYTSEKLFGAADESGTRLLTPEQGSINTLGQIYGRVQVLDQEFRGGRQLVDTPLINPQDNRMVPNTFEGITIDSLPDKDRNYDYAVGQLWNVKQRDSNDFISMSDALRGKDGTDDRSATFGMIKYRPIAGLSTVVADYYIRDYVNTGFAQVEYDFRRPKGTPNFIIGANVIDQRSVGDNLLAGSPFQTYQASGKVQMAHMGWTSFVAGSATGDQSKIFAPFGTKPNYTDMQQISFDNANEKAVGGSLAYDFGYAFSNVGLSGLSTGAWYTHGWGAIDPATGLGMANRDELDIWVQYRPSDGPFKGLRVKVQYGNVFQQGNFRDAQPELRFIVDYTVLLRPLLN